MRECERDREIEGDRALRSTRRVSIINESQIWWLISPDFKACTVFAMNFALNLARQFCVVARWGVVDYSARHL